ncbi:MAG: hypothetical protein Q8N97_00610 [Methanobacteriaceae archaeon]|nr:hypothetical protein [Methanobacteriaceae archaeon]
MITTHATMLVLISRYWERVGNEMLIMPALNDHKKTPITRGSNMNNL